MKSKFNKINKKYFIEDRIIKRHTVLSAKLPWLYGSIRGRGAAVWCLRFSLSTTCQQLTWARGGSHSAGGPTTTFWTMFILQPFRKMICSKEFPLQLSEAPSPFTTGSQTCSAPLTSSCAIHDVHGLWERQACCSLSILLKVWLMAQWGTQHHDISQPLQVEQRRRQLWNCPSAGWFMDLKLYWFLFPIPHKGAS